MTVSRFFFCIGVVFPIDGVVSVACVTACSMYERGGGLGSRPKKMYGERLGDGVEYHLMSPTPRR